MATLVPIGIVSLARTLVDIHLRVAVMEDV